MQYTDYPKLEIEINGVSKSFDIIFNISAQIEIHKLFKKEDYEKMSKGDFTRDGELLEKLVKALVIMANQSVTINNQDLTKEKKEPITEQQFGLYAKTSYSDIAGYYNLFAEAIAHANNRKIRSEQMTKKNE